MKRWTLFIDGSTGKRYFTSMVRLRQWFAAHGNEFWNGSHFDVLAAYNAFYFSERRRIGESH